jgi:hypothetical protein
MRESAFTRAPIIVSSLADRLPPTQAKITLSDFTPGTLVLIEAEGKNKASEPQSSCRTIRSPDRCVLTLLSGRDFSRVVPLRRAGENLRMVSSFRKVARIFRDFADCASRSSLAIERRHND